MSRDDWSRDDQRQAMRLAREGLIEELEALFLRAFERLSDLDLGEGAIARLTQLLLRSREAALTPLREEIEAPRITRAPGERTPKEQTPEEEP